MGARDCFTIVLAHLVPRDKALRELSSELLNLLLVLDVRRLRPRADEDDVRDVPVYAAARRARIDTEVRRRSIRRFADEIRRPLVPEDRELELPLVNHRHDVSSVALIEPGVIEVERDNHVRIVLRSERL